MALQLIFSVIFGYYFIQPYRTSCDTIVKSLEFFLYMLLLV